MKPPWGPWVIIGTVVTFQANVWFARVPASIVACPLAHPGVEACVTTPMHFGSHDLWTTISSTTSMIYSM